MIYAVNTSELREHELAGLIPEMRADEWQAFLADVKLRGVLEPLRLSEDGVTVLDGRHRLRAALSAGLATVPVMQASIDGQSETEYMVSAALLRRHLSDDQRAVMAARMSADVGKRRRSDAAKTAASARWGCVEATTATTHPRSRDVAAETFGVSSYKTRKAIRVLRACPEIAEQVVSGDLSLNKAAADVVRRERVAELAAREPLPDDERYHVLHGDFRHVDIADDSIDLILADPPYGREWLHLWGALGELAARVLRPGAFLVAYSGQMYLPQVMGALGEHLDYYWLAGLQHLGGTGRIFARNVYQAMKPILVYVKPPLARQSDWFTDLVKSPAADKSLHDWGQSVEPGRYLVRTFSKPGDLILDPMAGGGTFAVAAALEGRRALAVEIDAELCDVIRRRRPKEGEL